MTIKFDAEKLLRLEMAQRRRQAGTRGLQEQIQLLTAEANASLHDAAWNVPDLDGVKDPASVLKFLERYRGAKQHAAELNLRLAGAQRYAVQYRELRALRATYQQDSAVWHQQGQLLNECKRYAEAML